MSTQCNTKQIEFLPFKTLETSTNSPGSKRTRRVIAKFDSDKVSSDGGIALLREAEHRFGVIRRFAECFIDHRNPNYITHPLFSIVAQRVLAICLGYEDVNDHDRFRGDPIAGMFCGTSCALAGKSTVNRMELTTGGMDRYKKIEADFGAIDRLLVDMFIRFHKKRPKKIVIDIDITDDPLHGNQEGRFYHGYYGGYCYAPSYIFCGRHLLGCRLREANQDSAAGAEEELKRVISRIRSRWESTRIIIRGDTGFCRDKLMMWCEQNGVDYVLGMARNSRLMKRVKKQVRGAHAEYVETKRPSRRFVSFMYSTMKSWSRSRRVVCKAEHLEKGANTRFIVTSVKHEKYDAKILYEKVYCARGEMENRIKEMLDSIISREKTENAGTGKPGDVEILLSMPGVGFVTAATLVSEAYDLIRRRDYKALRCVVGTAPVTKQSGKSKYVMRRRTSSRRLQTALYHWAGVAVLHDPVSKARYASLRTRGLRHSRSLRTVGDRLLYVACTLLKRGEMFDKNFKKLQKEAA